jgi:hypothetical protein
MEPSSIGITVGPEADLKDHRPSAEVKNNKRLALGSVVTSKGTRSKTYWFGRGDPDWLRDRLREEERDYEL